MFFYILTAKLGQRTDKEVSHAIHFLILFVCLTTVPIQSTMTFLYTLAEKRLTWN